MTGGDTYHYTITDLLVYKKYCKKLISSKQYVNRKRNNKFLNHSYRFTSCDFFCSYDDLNMIEAHTLVSGSYLIKWAVVLRGTFLEGH